MSPPWNNFLRCLLRFVVVRSNHDKGLVRISLPLVLSWEDLDQFSLFFGGRRKKNEDTKKKFLNSVCRNVGRRSLGICPKVFGRMFSCAVIHTNRYTCLGLRFGAIQSVGTM